MNRRRGSAPPPLMRDPDILTIRIAPDARADYELCAARERQGLCEACGTPGRLCRRCGRRMCLSCATDHRMAPWDIGPEPRWCARTPTPLDEFAIDWPINWKERAAEGAQ